MSDVTVIWLVFSLVYLISMAYTLAYSYSIYATEEGNRYRLYSFLSFVPIVNSLLMLTELFDPHEIITNPLEDIKYLKKRYNSKLRCSKCNLNFYNWQSEREIVSEHTEKIKCPVCKEGQSSLRSINIESPVLEGGPLRTREVVAFSRAILKQKSDLKEKQYNDAYDEQEKRIYNLK